MKQAEDISMLAKRGSLRFEDLGLPIQVLLKETKHCGDEDLRLLEYITVKDVAAVFDKQARGLAAEVIWSELKDRLMARQRGESSTPPTPRSKESTPRRIQSHHPPTIRALFYTEPMLTSPNRSFGFGDMAVPPDPVLVSPRQLKGQQGVISGLKAYCAAQKAFYKWRMYVLQRRHRRDFQRHFEALAAASQSTASSPGASSSLLTTATQSNASSLGAPSSHPDPPPILWAVSLDADDAECVGAAAWPAAHKETYPPRFQNAPQRVRTQPLQQAVPQPTPRPAPQPQPRLHAEALQETLPKQHPQSLPHAGAQLLHPHQPDLGHPTAQAFSQPPPKEHFGARQAYLHSHLPAHSDGDAQGCADACPTVAYRQLQARVRALEAECTALRNGFAEADEEWCLVPPVLGGPVASGPGRSGAGSGTDWEALVAKLRPLFLLF